MNASAPPANAPEHNVTGIDYRDRRHFRYAGPLIDYHAHVMQTRPSDPPSGPPTGKGPGASTAQAETMLAVATYADIMRWVAQEHGVPLFDRLAIMRFWNDQGTFDLYAATKKYDMAQKVHDCIGRALASQIINAAHLTP